MPVSLSQHSNCCTRLYLVMSVLTACPVIPSWYRINSCAYRRFSGIVISLKATVCGRLLSLIRCGARCRRSKYHTVAFQFISLLCKNTLFLHRLRIGNSCILRLTLSMWSMRYCSNCCSSRLSIISISAISLSIQNSYRLCSPDSLCSLIRLFWGVSIIIVSVVNICSFSFLEHSLEKSHTIFARFLTESNSFAISASGW